MPDSTRHVEAGHDLGHAHAGPEPTQSDRRPADEATRLAGLAAVSRIATPVPDNAAPEIPATHAALGAHIVAGMARANSPESNFSGLQYVYNFRSSFEQHTGIVKVDAKEYLKELRGASRDDSDEELLKWIASQQATARDRLARCPIKQWDEDLQFGYADPAYFERTGFMSWILKPGKSAAQAVKVWLQGLTLCECRTTAIVLHYDALRAALGDARFDEQFSGPASRNRLSIAPLESAIASFMTVTESNAKGEAGEIGKRPAHPGDWYYFYNHPKYLLKHPGGAWQGENSIYGGERDGVQYWSGLGASNVTEDGMYDEMISAYNTPRDRDDEAVLKSIADALGGQLPKEYDPLSGAFPDQITKAMILDDPPYTIGGTTRKGGFVNGAGVRLDHEAISKMVPTAPASKEPPSRE